MYEFIQLIGWTPLIELKRIVAKEGINVRLIGKMEAYQPLSSVKDRCALRFVTNKSYSFLATDSAKLQEHNPMLD